ncbi:MAG: translational GTPase TypA [Candidatus Marinimicrobia bacterium]|nr:translational GTPase TypA [Candidatus Neomarinimicrobiota bacterium]
MHKNTFRNIAIVAHVDHGKTTLVDGMLKQSGIFSEHQTVESRVMDSMDLEKERGITITAKNTAVFYNNIKINIVDTPGHADFGGEVERSLSLVDGVLLLVDSSEGPLPQTRFVLKKALKRNLPVILIINKIDRPDSRVNEVINEVYDLFIDLGANDKQIDFPIIYTNAKKGVAHLEINDKSKNLEPLFNLIINKFSGPFAIDDHVPQFLITNLAYDSYVGQIAVGRLQNGSLKVNSQYCLCFKDGYKHNQKLSGCYTFKGLKRVPVDRLEAGDIIGIAGVENINIGDTISCNENPLPLPRIEIDKPTVSMNFHVNNGPFAGKDGKFLTSRNLNDRFNKELLSNVSLKIKQLNDTNVFEVRGRGELQMAVLIETMRREGFEFMVSKPEVITIVENDTLLEPTEKVFIDVDENQVGVVTEKLSKRKGKMLNLQNNGFGRVSLEFIIPSRGMIGFRSQFLTDTKGSGIMNSLFNSYKPWFGPIPQRTNGVMVADRPGKVTGYASLAMEDRGELFLDVGEEVYAGMVIGERNKKDDLEINITKEKKLTNMRSSTSEATVTLKASKNLSLDQCIEFIAEDELIEVTPQKIRLRKMVLDVNKRLSKKRKEKLNKK